jgi:putative ABC transport system permease protein
MSIATCVYRVLLRAFPPAFRRRFEADMTAVFVDRHRRARMAGIGAVLLFWMRIVPDVIAYGIAERRLDRRADGRTSMIQSVLQDARYGLRTLRSQPALTFTAIATLAIGIGATTAVFSVADAVFLRSLPYPGADRVVVLSDVNRERGFSGNVAVPNFDDWRASVTVFEAAAAWSRVEVNVAGPAGAERIPAGLVTGDFFDLVGARPIAGRVFGDDAREPGFDTVAVITEAAWSRLFGRAADAIGRAAVLDGVAHTVVGIVPRVPGLEDVEVFTPLARTGAALQRRNHAYRAHARLTPGVTVEQAESALDVVAKRLAAAYPETNTGWSVSVTPLAVELAGDVNQSIWLLAGVVGLLLLLTCTNVAGLLLSRASDRRREFAVRTALGAPRGRLIRQLLTESVVLSLLGAIAGLVVAQWSMATILRIILPAGREWALPSLSLPVLAFAAIVSVLTGILFGLAPALTVRQAGPQQDLRAGPAVSGGRRMRSVLAFAQLTLACVLLVGSALVLTSLVRILGIDPGFDARDVVTFRITPPRATHADGAALTTFFDTLSARLGALPQVRSAAATGGLPMAGSTTVRGAIPAGDPLPARGEEKLVAYQVSTPGYLRTLGMRVAGRDFTAADTASSRPVAIVNESMARLLFPDGAAIGREILIHTDETAPREVVGVVADVRYRGLERPILPQYFVPFAQAPRRTMTMAMKVTAPVSLADIRQIVQALDPSLPVYDVRPLDAVVRGSIASRQAQTATLTMFGGLAVLLAAIGLHGVIATGVRERRREIGIRMAIGASVGDVRRQFLRQGLGLAAGAVAAGLAASVALVSWSRELLFGLEALTAPPLAGVAAIVLFVALLATWLPARDATRVSPVETLRGE